MVCAPEALLDYMWSMHSGHALTQKGGDPEYRNGPQFKSTINGARQAAGLQPSVQEVERLLLRHDADRNGLLDLAEFSQLVSEMSNFCLTAERQWVSLRAFRNARRTRTWPPKTLLTICSTNWTIWIYSSRHGSHSRLTFAAF